MPERPQESVRCNPLWLRRADQATIAVLVLAALVAMAAYVGAHALRRGRLIEIDRAPPLAADFQVDLNAADWPELAQLPEIGETLARRIVASRKRDGPFRRHDDLRRVRGIGPHTLQRIRPYLLPLPPPENRITQRKPRKPKKLGSRRP